MKSTLRQLILTAFILLIVFTGVQFTLQSFRVEGASMEDSFYNGQYLLVNKLSYHFHSPHRGDVIVFHYPLDPSRLYIKRVIGLPGERVEIEGNDIYIDGELLREEPSRGPMGPPYKDCSLTVPLDEYFVLGDNRAHSDDSRTWGTVPRDNIIGKTWLSYWPLSEWGLSPEYSWVLE